MPAPSENEILQGCRERLLTCQGFLGGVNALVPQLEVAAVAEQQGFLNQADAPLFSLIPDYVVPGLSNETLATIAAGIIGVLVVMGVAIGVGAARRKRNTTG